MTEQRGLSRAVVERRATKTLAETAEEKLWRELDYFPTPPWAARAIAHRIKQLDPGASKLWEPACGEGHFAEPCKELFDVFASDIYAYGYGDVLDFLRAPPPPEDLRPDWIASNPPFIKAAEFIEHALRIARTGVVMLLRLSFCETVDRYPLLWSDNAGRLTTLMPFAERVPMQLGSWDPELSSATAYAAFCFHKGREATKPMGFPPGTRATYSRFDDAARFAKAAPIPLFEKMASAPLFTVQGEL